MTPPWLPILRDALDLEFPPDRPRIAILATVDEHHHPRARSVILRQLDDDGALHLTSDARSAKNQHLLTTPFAELVLYLPQRREQFRLFGPTTLTTTADDPQLLSHFWNNLSDQARATFTWPAPGHPWKGCDNAFERALPPTTPIPDSFTVITLRPTEVDRLQLSESPHHRTQWRATNGWQPTDLNP
jgi:PPOX class probable FMN-dependent enzyme